MKPDGDNAEQDTQIEGRYANHFQVGHNAFEFLLDFGQFYPESKKAQFHTRIVLGPPYAKALLEILQESISRYERTFATIPGEGPKADRSGNG
jgi:Protein of unknown function (DUF3467)